MSREAKRVQPSAQRLHEVAAELVRLPPPIREEQLKSDLVRNGRFLAELANDRNEFRLVVMGEFSAGKSTFVNAFIGRSVAATAATIETAHISVFRYGEAERARFVMRDGSEYDRDVAEAERLLAHGADARQLLAELSHVDYTLADDNLRNFVLVDTPGLATAVQEHEALTSREMDRAAAVLWIFDAEQPGSGTERKYLKGLDHRFVLGLVNKIDTVDDEERQEVLEECRQTAPKLLRDVLPLSALDAMEARQDGDQAALENSGLPAVRAYLAEHVIGREDLLREAGLKSSLRYGCQQLHGQLEARRREFELALTEWEQAELFLAQQGQVLLPRIRKQLINHHAHWAIAQRSELEQRLKRVRDEDSAQQLLVELFGEPVQREHLQSLCREAEKLYQEHHRDATAKMEEKLAEIRLQARTLRIVVEPPEGEQDWRDDAVSYGVPTALGLGVGSGLAIASAVIAWPVAVVGAIVGWCCGPFIKNWIRGWRQADDLKRGLRNHVRAGLEELNKQIPILLDEQILPPIAAAVAENDERFRELAREASFGGHTAEETRASLQRVAELEAIVREVAEAHAIDLEHVIVEAAAEEPTAK